MSSLPDGPHSARFELISRLGEGSMGVVFEALDRERHMRVALKTLRFLDGEMLSRFKREFRALQDLHHPNLVNLGELIEEGGHWFYTMELVEGVHFLEWVREGGKLDEKRLRAALPQLAAGLDALHHAGKVHRDVKPSNIVVTRDGRVVLLDFGLVVETGRNMSITRSIVGTAAYMAPEQATSQPVGPPADWYSLGSMLYEALTGHVPYEGMPLEVLARKQSEMPEAPRAVTSDAPADMSQLCMELIAREPGLRPRAEDVLARLGAAPPLRRTQQVAAVGTQVPIFVGRRKELSLLREARSAVREGHPVSVLVLGESGVGKSVLVRHFAEQLVIEEPETVLLDARCFERETVHYKAADGIIDAIARYMATLPQREAAGILPLKIGLLTQVFPALLRVEAVARAPLMHQYVKDPLELRARVFSAFRDLIARLSERRPLVVLVDDLQWADTDSLALLAALLRPPGAPGVLVLATARRVPTGMRAIEGDVREIQLEVLPQDQAIDLAAALIKRSGSEHPGDPAAIAREAGGHALLIDELVRHVGARGPTPHGGAQRLEDALWARISDLPDHERRLLEAVAIAGTPLMQQTAAVAAGLPPDDVARAVNSLRFANLLRTSGARAHDAIEPFHGRIRDTLLGYLGPQERTERHRRLAIAFEATDREDDESLAVHWAGAAEPERAAAHAERAAERAVAALAFDRAARLYRMAIELGGAEDHARAGELQLKLGDALANAGLGSEASAAFLAAAAFAKRAEAMLIRRRAADQLLRSGHIDEGIAIMRGVLAEHGWSFAPTPRRALVSLLVRRAQLKLRGLGYHEQDESNLPATQLARIDACWSIAQGLGVVDFIRSADYQARHMLLALQAGEPYRLTRAFAMEAGNSGAAGGKARARTLKLCTTTENLAERSGHPNALGMVPLMHGLVSFLEGRWREAWRHCDRAEVVLRERCTDVGWELSQSRLFAFFALCHLGDLVEASRRQKLLLREAIERGDRLSEVSVTVGVGAILWLARDDAAGARRTAGEAMSRWSHAGFQVQHCFDNYAASQADLYMDDAASAYRRLITTWPVLEDSQLLRVQLIRVFMKQARAAAAIALASTRAPGADNKRLLKLAAKDARALAHEHMDWSSALAKCLEACVLATSGELRAAQALMVTGIAELDKVEMRLFAAAARRRLGEWKGGAEGAALCADADELMRGQGIRKPDRFAWALMPGGIHDPWRDTASASATTRRNSSLT